MSTSRRTFLTKAGAAVAGLSIAPRVVASAPGRPSASDRIGLGVIGCKGMGFSNLQSFLRIPEIECRALCDVDRNVLDDRASEVEKMTGMAPELYGDFRAVLENPDIDAVIVATPDHWHCLMMAMACEAGKDVYVEKPLANSIEECHLMVRAAQKYNRVVQVGQWQRSGQHWQDAIDFVQSGQIGKVRLVKAWAYQGWMKSIPVKPDGPVPAGVDYDMWLGPAPSRPFNPNRFHFDFRWFWDYAGGLMTDWGVHLIDMAMHGMKATAPHSVIASGGKFAYPDDAAETPDTLQAVYEFDGFSMLWEHATGIDLGPYEKTHGVAFIGNLGTVVVDRGRWEVLPEPGWEDGRQVYKMRAMPVQNRRGGGGLDEHTQNFVDCMKSREQPACNTAIGSTVAVAAHMGNIAYKTGRKIYWDAATASFRNDAEANALMKASYRAPWKLPVL
ncbi:MAG: Gfo/Idh/MocA family oxidoreductase [Rhodothermales bacterium]|nr:Gfo/Idh/MocA family oxidoreductase [Rhodothermales bacterium]